LDKLVRSLKQKSSANIISSSKIFEQQIAMMANDPDIQRELLEIEHEFAVTELDGLEKV